MESESEALDLLVKKVKVCRVRVEGLRRTKNDIVVEQIKEVLKAETLNEMFSTSFKSLLKLKSMNVFKEIYMKYDTCQDKEGEVKGVEVVYEVKEAGMLKSSLSANAGTQTSDASVHLTFRNLFGRAEQLRTFSSTAFPNWGTTTGIEFFKPYYADLSKRLLLSLSNTSYKQPASGYQLYSVGPKIEVQFPSSMGSHSLMYLFDWRQLYGFDNGVPMNIRSQAGHSVKSSIKHTLETDHRDNPIVPCNGYRTKVTQEVAGLGGDVVFGRSELQTELYKEIRNGLVAGLSLWCGVVKSFVTSTNITDSFLLGGPTTIRGFEMWGTGPQSHGYSLGGEAYWAAALHLYHHIPFVNIHGFLGRFRLHSFANAGSLTNICNWTNLTRDIRLSCGCGLQVRLGMAQIELNYALPLKAQPTDRLKPGIQFGIGMEML